MESTDVLTRTQATADVIDGRQRPIDVKERTTDRVTFGYRGEIDGLRALSVFAVILFHARAPAFAGGYIGVDVFFVISGYLITGLLTSDTSQPLSRQLTTFYVRRARRILPALLFMLVVSTALASWLLLPQHLVIFGRNLALSTALLGNLGAWLDGSYFVLTAAVAPLRHLWSIAVEEQFYIAYPVVLLLLVRRLPRFTIAAIGVLAGMSFLICVWGSYDFPVANYYLAPSRGWQLLLGALVALNIGRVNCSRLASEILTSAALFALVAAIYLFDQSTRYPGVLALVPSVATAVLIASTREHRTAVGRVLVMRPLVFTGLISYSLYLWHAPLLVFFDYFNIVESSAVERATLIVVLYLLAAVSWWAVEQPIRTKAWLRSIRQFAIAALLTSVALVVIGVLLSRSDGLPQRLAPEIRQLMSEPWAFQADEAKCFKLSNESIAAGHLCRYTGSGSPTARALVWGDSHALALLPAYREIARVRNIEIYFAISPACRPLFEVTAAEFDDFRRERCAKFNAAMLRATQVLQPSVVVLNAYWIYPSMNLVPNAQLSIAPDVPPFRRGLEETVRRISAPTRSVCTVLDVPRFAQSVPYALAIAHRRGLDASFMTLSRDEALEQQRSAEQEIRILERRHLMRTVDPKSALCSGGTCRKTTSDGVSLYRDEHHLSVAGARLVADTLEGCFD